MSQPFIQVEKVKKYFKDVKAVDGVDLQINQGEFVAVLGPNGAGKTTLVEMIEGIQHPDSGTIFIEGKQWKGNEDYLHRIIGLSLQETRFMDKLNVRETLELFASFYSLDSKRVDEVIDLIRLQQKSKALVVNLSGGQRQRLALGIALLNNPKILLLDEPTTGLDPTARRELWNILLDLKKNMGTSLILTTHYMEEAEYLCDRIVIMYCGKILARGTMEELLRSQNFGQIIEFSLKPPFNKAALPNSINGMNIKWNEEQTKGVIPISNIQESVPEFLKYTIEKKLDLDSFECRKSTLDDLFIEMTGKHLTE